MQEVINENSNTNSSWYTISWGDVINENWTYNAVNDGRVVNRNFNIERGYRFGLTTNRNHSEAVKVLPMPGETLIRQGRVNPPREAPWPVSSRGQKLGSTNFWQWPIIWWFALISWLAKPKLPWRSDAIPREVEPIPRVVPQPLEAPQPLKVPQPRRVLRPRKSKG